VNSISRTTCDGGLLDAVGVIREITGAESVNTVSLCLGGTLSAIGLAYDASLGDHSIKSATLLNTKYRTSACPECWPVH